LRKKEGGWGDLDGEIIHCSPSSSLFQQNELAPPLFNHKQCYCTSGKVLVPESPPVLSRAIIHQAARMTECVNITRWHAHLNLYT